LLQAIALECDSNPGCIAIAWVKAKGAPPIIGPRTRVQLEDNLAVAAYQDRIFGGMRALVDVPLQPVR